MPFEVIFFQSADELFRDVIELYDKSGMGCQVFIVSLFASYRFTDSERLHGTGIDAVSEIVVERSRFSEIACQKFRGTVL